MTGVEWRRADPEELEAFDPDSRVCTMNCGPVAGDPRSKAERKLLCEDCAPAPARPVTVQMTKQQARDLLDLIRNRLDGADLTTVADQLRAAVE